MPRSAGSPSRPWVQFGASAPTPCMATVLPVLAGCRISRRAVASDAAQQRGDSLGPCAAGEQRGTRRPPLERTVLGHEKIECYPEIRLGNGGDHVGYAGNGLSGVELGVRSAIDPAAARRAVGRAGAFDPVPRASCREVPPLARPTGVRPPGAPTPISRARSCPRSRCRRPAPLLMPAEIARVVLGKECRDGVPPPAWPSEP